MHIFWFLNYFILIPHHHTNCCFWNCFGCWWCWCWRYWKFIILFFVRVVGNSLASLFKATGNLFSSSIAPVITAKFAALSTPSINIHASTPSFRRFCTNARKTGNTNEKKTLLNILRSDCVYLRKNIRRSKSLGQYRPDGNRRHLCLFVC